MSLFAKILFLLAALAALLVLPATAMSARNTAPTSNTQPPATSAKAYALLDAQSGTVLAEKNADTPLPMASTTKIMTALLAIELLDGDTTVCVPREAVGIEGSSIYLYEGERITVRTLLYALLLSSANDAATALAIEACGSVEQFAARMNQKAAQLGLSQTHFCNPHGLHEEAHYTTARDLARLTAAALANETFAEIVSTRRYTAKQEGTDATRLFVNHNKLLARYPDAIGVKTGFTKKSGRCLVSAAKRDGLTLICVTLSAPDDWRDHTALLDFGFSSYRCFSPDPYALTLPVVGGTADSVTLQEASRLSLCVPRDAEIKRTVHAPRFLFGGFDEGTRKGCVIYTQNGEVIAEVPLLCKASVAAERPLGFFGRIAAFFQHLFH